MKISQIEYQTKMIFRLTIVLITGFLLGCTTIYHNEKKDDPNWAPQFPEEENLTAKKTGSIYDVSTAKMLFQDKKALRIGDIITVVLKENTSATKNADTQLKKNNDVNTSAPTIGGRLAGEVGISLASKNEFKSETDSKQSNLLTGTISVTVQKVYTNGNLAIKGEKWISLNQGNEFIRVSGLIRPEDITKDNQVVSTQIANARIYYGGTGILAEANEEGWLTRFFNSGWWPL